jgi:hypothetical protein
MGSLFFNQPSKNVDFIFVSHSSTIPGNGFDHLELDLEFPPLEELVSLDF